MSSTDQNSSQPTPLGNTPPHLLWLTRIALILFALHMFTDNLADVDLWGNTGFVRALPGSPDFHTTNTYSYSQPDALWINHEWGVEYIFWQAFSHFGTTGLVALKTLLAAVLLTLLWNATRKQCTSQTATTLFLLIAISTIGFGFGFRPHLFTFCLIATSLFILKFYPGSKLIWMFPLLAPLWANLHGAFFIAVVLLTIVTILEWLPTSRPLSRERLWRRKVLPFVLILFVLATSVNPYGWALWHFIGESAGHVRHYLSEWAPFNPATDLGNHADFVILTLVSAAVLRFSHKPWDRTWVSLLALTFIAALGMRRNIPLFALTACFVIPEHLDDVWRRVVPLSFTEKTKTLGVAGLALLCALSLGKLIGSAPGPLKRTRVEIDPQKFPVQAMTMLADQKIQANALIYWDWAEYAIWHLHPNTKVFIDGRLRSAYGLTVINDYLAFETMDSGWDRVLTEYPTDMVLLKQSSNPIGYRLMTTRPGWELVYEDGLCALFLKYDRHAKLIDRFKRQTVPIHSPAPYPQFP